MHDNASVVERGRPSGPGRESFAWLFVLATALAVSAGLILASDGGLKSLVVVVGGVVGVSALAVLGTVPGAVEAMTLFALAATLSISLKFHPVFREGHLGGAVGIRISVADLLAALTLACAARRLLKHRVASVRIDRPILFAVAGYLVWATLSTAFGEDPALGVFELSALIAAFALFLVMSSGRWTPVWRKAVVAGLLCGLLVQSGVTIVQVLRPGALRLEFLGAGEETGGDDAASLDAVDVGMTVIEGETAFRPTGLLIHPNVLGAFFVLTMPIAVAVWFGSSRRLRWLASAALAAGGVALYLTLSRTGWAGTALAIGVFAIVARHRHLLATSRVQRAAVATVVVLGLAGIAWKADRIYSRLVDTAGDAVQFRRNLDVTAWKMALDNPLTGVGLNSFIYHARHYDPSGTSRLKLFPAHNVFLLELAESGFPGGMAFLLVVVLTVVRPWQLARCASDRDIGLLTLSIACGIGAFWCTQLSDYVYRIPVLTSIVWTYLGFALGIGREAAAP